MDKYIRHSPAKFSLDLNEDMCNLICVYLRRGGMENVGLSGHKYTPSLLSQPPFLTPPHISPGKLIFGRSRQEGERDRYEKGAIKWENESDRAAPTKNRWLSTPM